MNVTHCVDWNHPVREKTRTSERKSVRPETSPIHTSANEEDAIGPRRKTCFATGRPKKPTLNEATEEVRQRYVRCRRIPGEAG